MALFKRKQAAKQEQQKEAELEQPSAREQTEEQHEEPPAAAHHHAPKPVDADAQPAQGGFLLEYTADGVYMTLKCTRPLTAKEQEALVRHIYRKKLTEPDMDAVLDAIVNLTGARRLIAPPQQENHYDASFMVEVSADLMEARMTVLPPEPELGRLLDAEAVLGELRDKYQIVYGLEAQGLREFLLDPIYDIPFGVAKGLPPVTGKDGELVWHFERRDPEAGFRMREVAEDEKADYKNLDLFTQVKQDDLLVTRTPPEEGTPGCTVTGRPLSAQSGKNYPLPRGKNTYIANEGRELRAGISGRVEEVNGQVDVSNFFCVHGDVDLSVGNIDFDGDVLIEGNVLSNYNIKASGNIEVRGIVEASELTAGGDIVIKGGIQGAGRGMLAAKGGVHVRFAEYTTIQAVTIVTAESLLHSNVSCYGAVEVLNGRGSIVGGNVCAGTYIAANLLGTSNGRATGLEVGMSPSHRAEIDELEGRIATLKREMQRLQGIIDEIADATNNTRQQKMRMENVRRLLQCKSELQQAESELNELKGELDSSHSGQIHALKQAFGGVCISIGLSRMMVNQTISYATFRIEKDEVQFTSCRFKPQPMRRRRLKR